MMRAPTSRMDILSESELKTLLDDSKLTLKYNETIDRESAYEILTDKIEKAELAYQEEQNKPKPSTSKTQKNAMNPVVKVLTSATFIRAAFDILKRVIK